LRAALLLFVLALLVTSGPAVAGDWIALWLHEGVFLGLTEGGDVYRYSPGTGTTEFAGSLGPGPWISFGKNGESLLALKPNGEVWSMNASSGAAGQYLSLPSDREWCALQQHPDVIPSYAISCSGEIWSLWEPLRLLADFGPCATGRWICIANADDSYFATLESGDVRQGTAEWCEPAGRYGPGPWVGFSRTYGMDGSYLALKPNGEIWAHSWTEPSLYLALPSDREWCGFLTGPVWNAGPGYAVTCSGEIWSVASPPEMIGAFELPTPVKTGTWGGIRAIWR
jgi:hypothetical protein